MMGFMIYFAINIRFLRFLRFFEKWSELGKIGKNGEKCLSQNPHFYTTCIHKENFPLFSSTLKLSSAHAFNLKESKMCRLGKG